MFPKKSIGLTLITEISLCFVVSVTKCAGFSSDEDLPAPRHRKRTYMNQPHLRFEITSDDGFSVQASSIEGKTPLSQAASNPAGQHTEIWKSNQHFPSSRLASGDGRRPGGPSRFPPEAAAAWRDGRTEDDGRHPRRRHLPARAAAGRRQLQAPPLPLSPLRRPGGGAATQPQRLRPLGGLHTVTGSQSQPATFSLSSS